MYKNAAKFFDESLISGNGIFELSQDVSGKLILGMGAVVSHALGVVSALLSLGFGALLVS